MTNIDAGVNFPLIDGTRSSTVTGKAILAEAVRADHADLAARIEREPDWRLAYPAFFTEVTALEARSAELALDVARRGLAAARETFVVEPGEGTAETFGTHEVRGSGPRVAELVVPYEGADLRGEALLRQLDEWAARGITEPSFADAVGAVVRHPEWVDLSDLTFAVVGAGAQMGPFRQLTAWGATVAAVDLPRPGVWEQLRDITERSAGRLLAPVRPSEEGVDWTAAAGANLLTDVEPLADWLSAQPGPMTLGNYGYADGPVFVRLSVASDLLLTDVASRRNDLSLAYLATPSDAFLVPKSAVAEANERYRRLATKLPANYSGAGSRAGDYGLVDAFILAQGQNYALAKRLQRWRMLVARAEGVLTSVHLAPPTRTRSVHSNPQMVRRQRIGARLGLETFDAATSQALSAAMLVHDLRNPDAPANPSVPLAHPHEIFMFAANPGGRWRIPLEPNGTVPLLESSDDDGESYGDLSGLSRGARLLGRASGSSRAVVAPAASTAQPAALAG